jgi:hypothetical protein
LDGTQRVVRRECAGRPDLAYGIPRASGSTVLAADPKAPALTFLHGGYWQMNEKENFAFFAEGLLPLGTNLAVIEYTLARRRGSIASLPRYTARCGGSPSISPSTAPTRTDYMSPDIEPAVT